MSHAPSEVEDRWVSNVESHERLLSDGCFDLFHFGHANALRQAKLLGGWLVAATHTDQEIRRCKGEPIYPWEERVAIVSAVKWVDELIPDAPYSFTVEDLRRFKVDYTVHGDDISVGADGRDCHADLKAAGMYKMIRRTRGISSTLLMQRLLNNVTSIVSKHSKPSQADKIEFSRDETKVEDSNVETTPDMLAEVCSKMWCRSSYFNSRSTQIVSPCCALPDYRSKKVVYTSGSFDLCHAGVVDFLEKAKSNGDHLVVGVFSSASVKNMSVQGHPLMTLEQRALCLSSLKFVDEVLLDAPTIYHQDVMSHYNVRTIVTQASATNKNRHNFEFGYPITCLDVSLIRAEIKSMKPLITFETIVQRLNKNYNQLLETLEKKQSLQIKLVLPGNQNNFT